MELFKLLGTIAVDNTEANTAIDDTTGKAENAEGKTKKSFGGIGKAAGTIAKGMVGMGAAVGGALIAAVESTREYRAQMGMLETAFTQAGHSSSAAKDTYTELNAVLGDSGQATEAAQQLAKLTGSQKDLDTMTNALTGVYATFGEALPVEGLAEAANHTAKVGEVQGSLADALEWSGITVDSFNAHLAKCSTEQERQQLITKTLNDLYGEAGQKYKEVNKDVLDAEKAQGRMTDALARVGAAVEPVMTIVKNGFARMLESVLPFAEFLAGKIPGAIAKTKAGFDAALPYLRQAWAVLWAVVKTVWDTVGKPVFSFVVSAARQAVDFFRKNFPAIQKVVRDVFTIIKSLWNSVLKPVLKLLGDYVKNTLLPVWKVAFNGVMKVVQTVFNGIIKLWNGSLKPILNGIIQFVSGVLTGNWKKAWNGIQKIVSGVFSGIKTVISTVLSTIKSIFSAGLSVVRATASNIFGAIKDKIAEKINGARDAVKKAIDKIKGFFNFKWKLPALKIPKIGVSGKFSLDPPSIPKFSLKWNAQGGVLTKPTIFGAVGDTFLGGGESGAEAIAPISVLQDYIRQAVSANNRELVAALVEQNRQLIDFLRRHMPKEVLLDSGAIVGELSPEINARLGAIYRHDIR